MNSKTVRISKDLNALVVGDFVWDHHYGIPRELKEWCLVQCSEAPYDFVERQLEEKVEPHRSAMNKCVYVIAKEDRGMLLACCFDSRAYLFSIFWN